MIEKDYFDVILNEDKDDVNAGICTEIYSTDNYEAFMCTKCFNLHKLVVKKEINYNSRFTLINSEDTNEQFDDPSIIDRLEHSLSHLSIPTHIYLKCDNCGKRISHAILDYELAPIISKLNKKGYNTHYSCSGHYDMRSIPYITFETKVSEKDKYEKMLNVLSRDGSGLWEWEVMMENDHFIKYKLQLNINKCTIDQYYNKEYLKELLYFNIFN